MMFIHLVRTSFAGLRVNKVRTGLTVLGIVIGVAAIITIVSIGQGAQGLILKEIGGLGADMIVIRPGQEPTGPTDVAGTLFSNSLKAKDIAMLERKENVPYLSSIAPVVFVPETVAYESDTYRAQVFGWVAEFMAKSFDVYPAEGVLFTDVDIHQRAAVAVIGSKVKDELFGASDALGKYIKIKDKNFRVIGIFPAKGQLAFLNIDDVVIVPYTTAQAYLLGIDYFNEVMARAQSADIVLQTVNDIELTLRESHGIADPSKDDFFVVTQEGLLNQITTILGALTAFLSSVVAISLIVGGIGVMNIMLVSVTERTREIGLRKAVGATDRDILRQFLIEAVLITGIGGIIGVAVGALLSFFITIVIAQGFGFAFVFSFPIPAAFLGVGVSALVGVIFGIYPARKASRKSPIEALRYE